jgi:3-dehydroquinate dehydratase
LVSREKIISIGMQFQLMIWFVLNPAARDVISYGVASASISPSTVNVLGKGYMSRVHDREQQRRTAIVSVVGQQNS